jgi:hypothetical protein
MASYQPPNEQTAIFNSQNFTTSYSGQHDPTKMDFPIAQGIPTMVGVNVTSGTNTNLITPTGIVLTNSTGNSLLGSKTTWGIGADNTVLGVGAGANGAGAVDTVGNTCIGKSAGGALLSTTSGQASSNSLVGRSAGSNITTGSSNVCVGQNAGQNIQTGGLNVCVGLSAGGSATTSGNANTFLGALTSSTINVGNATVIGYNAQATASNQVVLGTSAETVIIPSGFINTSANNIFFSSVKPSLGNFNVGIGIGTFQSGDTSTVSNVAVGLGALQNCKSNSNIGVGQYSLPNLTTGSGNVALGINTGGVNAGTGLTTGSLNTFVGVNSNVASGQSGVNRSTAIGQNAIITASNQIVMGTATESVALPARHSLGLVTQISSSPSISTTTSFTIATIDNGTAGVAGTAMTTIGNPQLQVGMYISIPQVTTYVPTAISGVTITAQTGINTWTISSAQLVLVNVVATVIVGVTGSYYQPTYPLSITTINNGTAGTAGTTMTISTSTYSPTLPAGTLIFGAGILAGTTIVSGLGNTYTISAPNQLITSAITGGYSSPNISINFPLSEIYYITPQATAITITLPTITSINVGAKITFRTTSTGAGSVSLASLANNIFVSTTLATPTSATPNTGSHTIYTGGSTALLTHTFICLPTTIGGTAYAYGWFQLGTV